jgi:hypothetical protein
VCLLLWSRSHFSHESSPGQTPKHKIIAAQRIGVNLSGGFFIIGRTTEKDYGKTVFVRCPNCHNETALHLVYRKTWFEYFFIKIFPYRRQYLLVCKICTRSCKLEGQQIDSAKRMNQAMTAYLNKTVSADEYKSVLSEVRNDLRSALGMELVD